MPDEPRARILVVDDDPAQLHALCDALTESGYFASGFCDPDAALQRVAAGRFDLLMTDLRMPGMDGISLLREALAIDPDVMAIIMTGEGTIDTALDAMKSGAFDYILKPCRLRAILPVLSRALTVRRLREEKAALERQMRTRNVELEVANRELDAYARSVSHDLRAPLRGLVDVAGILEEECGDDLGDYGLRLVRAMKIDCERMARLVDDLLAFSRYTRQPLKTHPFLMTDLVNEILDELRPSLKDRSIAFTVADLGIVLGDRSLLKLALQNLLGNAIKYTSKMPCASIEVGLAPQPPDASVFFVKDNGAGFDMRKADRLFTPFERMHRQEDFEGTGVGLATVQRVIQRHGGRIWAEAAVGRGATFHFTLPTYALSD